MNAESDTRESHLCEQVSGFLYRFLGCVQTISVVGPVFGYLLGSLCAKIYVDIGFVAMGEFFHNYIFRYFKVKPLFKRYTFHFLSM